MPIPPHKPAGISFYGADCSVYGLEKKKDFKEAEEIQALNKDDLDNHYAFCTLLAIF